MGLARRSGRLALLGAVVALAALPSSASASTRIIGGSNASQGEFPYQVLLDLGGAQCGGSILSPTKIVTAAHCVEDTSGFYPQIISPATVSVFYGGVNRPGGSTDMISVNAPGAVDHISVDRRRQRRLGFDENDSAILTLANPLTLDGTDAAAISLATPPQLASAFSALSGDRPWITGWGLTDANNGNSISEILQKVRVPLVPDSPACANAYAPDFTPSVMLCAGDVTNGGVDTCQGDSGGPLAIDITAGAGQSLRLAGITSFGQGCAEPGFPGVYTEVPEEGTTDFLTSSPPGAPRVLSSSHVTGTARVGQTVTCVPPAGASATQYFWYTIDSFSNYSLFSESGPNVVLPAVTLNRRVECDVRLENTGGYQYIDGTPGATGPVGPALTSTPTVPGPAKDTTRPKARIQKVRCKRRRCTVTIKATDTGGIVKKVSGRVKGKYKSCRLVGGERLCRTRKVNKRLRLRKKGGGIYVGKTRLKRGRYRAYARARDSAGLRSTLARKKFRVR